VLIQKAGNNWYKPPAVGLQLLKERVAGKVSVDSKTAEQFQSIRLSSKVIEKNIRIRL